jgi:hypothetical protein
MYATCVVNPSSAALGGTSTITVTLATSVASLSWPQLPGRQPLTWLVCLLPLGLFALKRPRAGQLRSAAILCCVLMVAGCGASRMIPDATGTSPVNPVTPTPSGSYSIVVTGSSAGLTRSISLTLIVQ